MLGLSAFGGALERRGGSLAPHDAATAAARAAAARRLAATDTVAIACVFELLSLFADGPELAFDGVIGGVFAEQRGDASIIELRCG